MARRDKDHDLRITLVAPSPIIANPGCTLPPFACLDLARCAGELSEFVEEIVTDESGEGISARLSRTASAVPRFGGCFAQDSKDIIEGLLLIDPPRKSME